jgi:hypothetical protein
MGRHRPSRRSELDLLDLQVRSYCKRCGATMVRSGHKWQIEEPAKAA